MSWRLDLRPWTRFGRLVVLWETIKKNGRLHEKCLCDCGIIKFVSRNCLRRGNTKSCWCLHDELAADRCLTQLKKHGLRYSRIYKIYYGICNRCNNAKASDYGRYWGRWIKCLWNSFEEFYRDMNLEYENHVREYWERDTTIERIDSNWNYCKDNCRWATRLEQCNNTSKWHCVEYWWRQYKTISSMCRELWLSYQRVRSRIRNWWDIVSAVEKPFIKLSYKNDRWN